MTTADRPIVYIKDWTRTPGNGPVTVKGCDRPFMGMLVSLTLQGQRAPKA